MVPRHSQLITESPQDQALMTQIIEAAQDEDEVSRFVTKFKMGQTAVSADQVTAAAEVLPDHRDTAELKQDQIPQTAGAA